MLPPRARSSRGGGAVLFSNLYCTFVPPVPSFDSAVLIAPISGEDEKTRRGVGRRNGKGEKEGGTRE